MPQKLLGSVLITAILANLAVVCVGHSHGHKDGGQRSHVHLHFVDHDHSKHDHSKHDHSKHEHSKHEHSKHDHSQHSDRDYSDDHTHTQLIGDGSVETVLRQQKSNHDSDAIYLVDFDLERTTSQKASAEKNFDSHASSFFAFEVDCSKASLESQINPSNLTAFAPAQFLQTVRFLL